MTDLNVVHERVLDHSSPFDLEPTENRIVQIYSFVSKFIVSLAFGVPAVPLT
jgi:hypothetical protein